jgi:hypothetical protein
MSTTTITKAKNFDVNTIKYGEPQINARGGKSIKVMSEGRAINLQFPITFTWGINKWEGENGAPDKYDVSLQFDKSNSSNKKFLDTMIAFQNKLMADSVTNSHKWFGRKKIIKEVAEAMWWPMVKYRKDKNTGEPDLTSNPSLKVKIGCYSGEWAVDLFDMTGSPTFRSKVSSEVAETIQGSKTPVDLVPSKSHMKGIMTCGGLYIAAGRVSCSWRLQQANVRPPQNLVGSGVCAVLSDSDDEAFEEELKSKEEEEDEIHSEPTFDDDDDDDDDIAAKVAAEVEEEVQETKPKKVKRKVVRKKKVTVEH